MGVDGNVQRNESVTGRSPGLLLGFAAGARPDRACVTDALAQVPRASISFDPALAAPTTHVAEQRLEPSGAAHWLELLRDGLTFDLVGLAPGCGLPAPDIAHRFHSEIDADAGGEWIGLFPGPHIAGSVHLPPILRSLMGLGAALAEALPGVDNVSWPPARSAIAPRFFIRTVGAWLEGGPFPALGLAGFSFTEDGSLRSEGLRLLIGRELTLDRVLASDRSAAMSLAVRLTHRLVAGERFTGELRFHTDSGAELILTADPGDALIHARPG